MKKILFLAVFAAFTTFAQAQKGSWYIGGNVGFSSSKDKTDVGGTSTDGPKTTTWTFSPEVGTWLSDKVQVGIGLTLGGSKLEGVDDGITTTHTSSITGATLYGRYWFMPGSSFRPFIGLNISGLPGSEKVETKGTVTTEVKYSTFDLGANINAGFGYALSPKFTVVGSFGFIGFESSSTKLKDSNPEIKTTTTSFGLDAGTLGNRFTVGVYYTL